MTRAARKRLRCVCVCGRASCVALYCKAVDHAYETVPRVRIIVSHTL